MAGHNWSMDATSPTDPGAMRASDTDRNQVAELLGEAMAAGRLTTEEYSQRLDAVYAARTFGDLEELVGDLPLVESLRSSVGAGTGAAADGAAGGGDGSERLTRALFSKIRRGGQWQVPAEFRAVSRFGAIVLDLRHAEFTHNEVTLDAISFCGKIEIYVPANARVYDTGGAVLGKRSLLGGEPTGSDGPVIRIRGRSVLGHTRVVRSSRDRRANRP
ncbi:MAG TPA: DUF1707 domain-containing protein [Mycobacteriales bacterium]|nr:DUF1707 domain-containing protein [Mycobacteriales bacterium]